MKRTLHIITIAIVALLSATTANAVTQYCEKAVISTVGQTGEKLIFTATKTGEMETTFTLYSETSVFKGIFDVALQLQPLSISSTTWKKDWTLVDNKFTKVVTWNTMPEFIQLYIVARRDNSKGGSDLIGATFTDIDIAHSCSGNSDDDSGDDSGDSGTTTPTGPSNIDWNTIPTWVNENGKTEHKEQFKAQAGCGTVHYIQDYQQELCIYVAFGKNIMDCNVAHHKVGGQLFLCLSALTARETQVTVTFADDSTCSFWIYNAHAEVPEEPTADGVCTYEGFTNDGLTAQPGKDLFATGYEVTLQLDNTLKNIIVKATTNDGPATKAVFQNYYTFIEKEANNEQYMDGDNTSTFTKTIPVSWIKNKEDGIIRFAIKFEYPNGVIKVTTPEFFYLDGSGCAQRVFAIYHHDDFPATPVDGEDAFTQFEGGRILQQIQYKRILRPDTWETFCVPFEVDSVTVYDPDDQQNYHLHAQYNNGGTTVAGHFWLREFTTREVILDAFQPNWHDITATSQVEALPKKDVPYIIRVPAGDYYTDKYVVFHGKGYQTIASEYDIPTAPADNYFSYSGNNTMMPQTLTSAYVLESAGYYFQANSSGVTLHPFECSVNASATTIARMPRISLNDRERTVTDVETLPTTDLSDGVIYTVYGAAVAEFHSLEQYDEARAQLPAGVYLVTTPTSVIKICVQ